MFKQHKIYYLFVSLPFILLLVGAAIFADGIKYTIVSNPHPQINFTIFTIILVGGVLILLNARRLLGEARNMVEFFGAVHAKKDLLSLQNLANNYSGEMSCLLQMVSASGGRAISHQEQVAIENELGNTRASLLRRNALPQYLTGLLVGMGLLGTFIGLLATLSDITVLISSFADLDMQNASPLLVFRTMIDRMRAPMQSMGIAFSASMFGLLGSIILGLMMVGIRRLQGDMFSMLSSEVGRHIEMAIAHESVTLKTAAAEAGVTVGTGEESGVAKLLIKIEERYAEAARSQQRALSMVIDDLQKQRADMLSALSEQTGASNSFCAELRQIGGQLGEIFSTLEKGSGALSGQVSDLTVNLAGDARETQKLLARQVEEQKKLRDTIDSYNIGERLTEATRSQQRTLSAVSGDLEKQRADILRALTAQTEASDILRGEMQQFGGHLGSLFNLLEKGNGEISSQISELTVQMAADGKESHRLLDRTGSSLFSSLQHLGNQLGVSSNTLEKGNEEICTRISELTGCTARDAKKSQEQFDLAGNTFRGGLKHISGQLGDSFEALKQGNEEICNRISELMDRMAADAEKSHKQVNSAGLSFRSELQQLGDHLGAISTVTEKGNDEICTRISNLLVQMAGEAEEQAVSSAEKSAV